MVFFLGFSVTKCSYYALFSMKNSPATCDVNNSLTCTCRAGAAQF